MRRKTALSLTVLLAATGCGAMGIPYYGNEELHASIAPTAVPPASPGFLALLPAKKGEATDPGEITDKLKPRWGVQLGAFGDPPNGGGRFYSPRLAVAALFRLGPDRRHPVGLELSAGHSYLPVGESDVEYDGADYDLLGARVLFDVGGQWLFLVAGIELVREAAHRKAGGAVTWTGACLEIGANFRVTERMEFSVLFFRLPKDETIMFGSDPTRLMMHSGFRFFF